MEYVHRVVKHGAFLGMCIARIVRQKWQRITKKAVNSVWSKSGSGGKNA
jgi:hypothetical protein